MQNDILNDLFKPNGHHGICLIGEIVETRKVYDMAIKQLALDPGECWESIDLPLTIESVRALKKWVNYPPASGNLRLIWLPLDDCRPESTNALLKTIEEPPDYIRIIASVRSSQNLAATIKSRLKMVWLGQKSSINHQLGTTFNKTNIVKEFLNLSKTVKAIAAGTLLDQWLLEIEPDVRQGKSIKTAQQLLDFKAYSQTNVNQRVLIENAFLARYGADNDF